jgi:hypothetical protein
MLDHVVAERHVGLLGFARSEQDPEHNVPDNDTQLEPQRYRDEERERHNPDS